MNIFITGASGFVGGHVAEALSAAGHQVSALSRSEKSAATVRGYGARPVQGDLDTVGPAQLAGAEVVIHCAAYAEEWGTREQFEQANVEGTRRVLQAARAAGVRRFLFIGTEAALFDGHALVGVDETAPYPARQRFLYSETKAAAERLVLAANGPAMATLSLRPRFVWGPRDTSVLPAVARMAKAGSFSWIDGGRALTSTTHVSNLVHAVTLALTRGESGRAYFIADDGERTMREFLTALLHAVGVQLPARSAPGWLARPLAAVIEGTYRLLGLRGTPPMTRFAVSMMSRTVTVRTDRARAELGYAPVISVEEGLRQLRQGAGAAA